MLIYILMCNKYLIFQKSLKFTFEGKTQQKIVWNSVQNLLSESCLFEARKTQFWVLWIFKHSLLHWTLILYRSHVPDEQIMEYRSLNLVVALACPLSCRAAVSQLGQWGFSQPVWRPWPPLKHQGSSYQESSWVANTNLLLSQKLSFFLKD